MRFYDTGFQSRRSVVMSRRGMAASSQPLAVETAINVIRAGGNAIDAAVAATFVLAVIEPMSTGLGGDCFTLIYLAREKRLIGLNASGRAPQAASPEAMIERGFEKMPLEGPLSVTVPGAVEGLHQCLSGYGTLTLEQALEPAIYYAQEGFPVTEIAAQMWKRSEPKPARNVESARVYLPPGRAPLPGEVFRNPDLARTLRLIAEGGVEAFYRGDIAKAIVASLQDLGGQLSLEDLAAHAGDWVEPLKSTYRGYTVAQMPPNNQGITALLALNIVEGFELPAMGHNSPTYLHCMIEAMKLALSDARASVGDPDSSIRVAELLSKSHAQKQRSRINPSRASIEATLPTNESGDTVYIAVVDQDRNFVSMISSVFKAFGSGITVPGTGLILQNRGAGFSLEQGHPNRLAPGKRPFHTIMPAMILKNDRPWACLGVVGGLMQAQGQLQATCNLIDFDMNPQAALDAPRFRVVEDGGIALEEGIPDAYRAELQAKGHRLKQASAEEGFGGGQIVLLEDETLFGGSDPRKDGCAIGY